MRYIELFAGIGGFRLGIERSFDNRHEAGGKSSVLSQAQPDASGESLERTATCVYANEFDKYAAQTYNKNFGGSIDTRDITTVPTSDIPDHDLLVGGFPCQAFSVAGKRRGFDDTRGTLFFDVARILRDKRPRHLVLENVKGLLSHDGGKTIQTIFGVLSDLGYEYQWQVLNSKDFGVPQNRERIFIVGHLRGKPRPQVFPFGEAGFSNRFVEKSPESSRQTISTLTARGAGEYHAGMKLIEERGDPNQRLIDKKREQNTYSPDGIARTLKSEGGSGNTPMVKIDAAQSQRVRSSEGLSSTINSRLYDVGARIRRLTPIECERLQGFPDHWTQGVSDTQRYKQMGNAVTVNVVEAVIRKLFLGIK